MAGADAEDVVAEGGDLEDGGAGGELDSVGEGVELGSVLGCGREARDEEGKRQQADETHCEREAYSCRSSQCKAILLCIISSLTRKLFGMNEKGDEMDWFRGMK